MYKLKISFFSQVSGELSNAGAPMRRFTQTFVLAAQAPKKYYVQNDIFRYQDSTFNVDMEVGSMNQVCEQEREIVHSKQEEEDHAQAQQLTSKMVNADQHALNQQQLPQHQMYYSVQQPVSD